MTSPISGEISYTGLPEAMISQTQYCVLIPVIHKRLATIFYNFMALSNIRRFSKKKRMTHLQQ